METTGFCDWREVRDELGLTEDSRIASYSHKFAAACRKANGEILDALRPRYSVEDLFLKNQTSEAISGTTTSERTNEINLSTGTWTVNLFAESSIGFPVEAVIYVDATPEYWIADVVSNTAIKIVVNDIDGGDITIPLGAKFYLRMKVPGLQSIAVGFGMYQFMVNNRTAKGVSISPTPITERRDQESTNLGMYIGGALALPRLLKEDSITLANTEWKRLSKKNIDSKSVVVELSDVEYFEEQGWEMDYYRGRIRYRTPDSDQLTKLTTTSAITVKYRYKLRGNVFGVV